MDMMLSEPVQPPLPSDDRLAQRREHLLAEITRPRGRAARHIVWPSFGLRRRTSALVAIAMASVFAVSAVAANQGRLPYWTFGSSDDPSYAEVQTPRLGSWTAEETAIPPFGYEGRIEPGESVRVPTIDGVSAGKPWKMQAFVGMRGYLCFGLSAPAPGTSGYFSTCDSRADWFFTPPASAEDHAVQYGVAIPGQVGSGPKYVYGTAASNVARVDLESDDGTVVTVGTFSVSDDVGLPARLWVAVLRLDHLVHTLVARDTDGNVLDEWEMREAL